MGLFSKKDPREEAEKGIRKGKLYLKAEKFKKAGKYFTSAAENYYELHEFEIAKEAYYKAAKAFLNDRYDDVVEALRKGGDASLFLDEYKEANEFFKNALKYVTHLRKDEDRFFHYILFSSLSYLCLFIKGKQDLGLTFIKQVKNKVDADYFNENPLIRLVKNLTIAIRDKNKKYLDKVEANFEKYKFRKAEEKLIKEVLVVAKSHVTLKTKLTLDKDEYTTKDKIKLILTVDTSPLLTISDYEFYNYEIEKIEISNIGVTVSDNFTTGKKPDLPRIIKAGESQDFEFVIDPHFQLDKPFIGPLLLTCEIDEKFIFFLKTKIIHPNLISPPPSLEISMETLKTPLVGQTFPLEFTIENSSQGDALNVEVNLEFPEELRIMRGTTEKQIYSLPSNDKIVWQLNIRPIDSGDYEIKLNVKFKDPDQNIIEYSETFPLALKL
ncbi:MAG: hypothetical protein ACOC35_04785 [Promethearchaeia archaeon]